MATSGITTYTRTRDQLISFALRKIGVLELGVTPDATTVTNVTEALDMLIKSWVTKGIKLWTIQEVTVPLTASTSSYTIAPSGASITADKPLKLISARLKNTSVTPNIDTPLLILSQEEYNRLGSKASTGVSNSVYLQVGRDSSTLYVFLTPTSTEVTNYDILLVTQRLIQDVGSSSANLDFPVEWFYAIGWNLAAELCVDYGVDSERVQYIEAKAAKFLQEVEDFDVEYASTFFVAKDR